MNTFCLLLPLNPYAPYFIGRNFRGCALRRNSFILQGFIFADQAIFGFSPYKVPFVSILPLKVLHVRLMYFRVCKIHFFFNFLLSQTFSLLPREFEIADIDCIW